MAFNRDLSQLASFLDINADGTFINIIPSSSQTNLGIGTNNPTAKLDVLGNARVSGNLSATNINASGIVTATSGFVGALTGLASSATQLATGRTIAITGDLTYTSGSFNGTGNVTGTGTLANTTVTAGSYGSSTEVATFTVDSKGRLTAAGTASVGTALTVAGDSGSENISLLSEVLTISGGTNLNSSAASNTVTINLDNNISLTSVVASGIITATSGFSGNVTGNLTGEVNSPSFDTNASGVVITGVTTSSSGFVGNVTGNLTGNINSSGVSTVTSLNATNINASGIVTATSGFVGALTGNVTGNVTGNINSSGVSTVTSLNATNINASGIVTATSGFVGNLTGTATSTTNIPNLSGDITSANTVTTLATVNSNVGSFGSQTLIPVVTVNAKGLVTAVTTAAVGTALTVSGDSGSENIDLLSEVLTISGGTNLTSSAASNTLTINLDNNISLTSVVASGIITATSGFVGNVTGNINSSGVSTVTSLNATNINASGIVTAAQFVTGASGAAIGINTNTISGPATITIDPAAVGDNTGLVVIKGDLQIDGTTTTINSTTVTIDDKNIQIADGAANDAAADGAGFTIVSGDGNKTFQFQDTGDNLGSSENLNIASGKVYKVNNTEVLSSTTLGSGVVNSSLTSVGTLTNLSVGNVNSSGIVTATTFVGALTGNVTGNLTGEVNSPSFDTNASGVVITGVTTSSSGFVGALTGNVTGNLSGNINSSGVSTVTSLIATNINASGIVTATSGFVGALTGLASSATQLATGRTIAITGDLTYTSGSFNGTGNVTGTGTLANTAVTPGSYGSSTEVATFTVDSKGRLTAAGTASVGTALTVAGDSGSENISLLSEVLTISGGTNLTSSAASNTLTINLDNNISLTSIVASGIITATSGFVGNVTGNLTGEVNSPSFDTNASGVVITGVTTSSSGFVGALTGNVTGNINSSGVSTVTSLNATNINASGIVTATSGFVGNLTGTAATTTNIPNLTGDITSLNLATTLATVNSNVGSFGSQTLIPVVTVNAKGLVTAVTTAAVGTALTVTGDSGSENIDLLSETLTISGGTNLTSSATSNTLTVNLDPNISLTSVVASGIITATSGFSGNVTGNVTGNINSSGVSTVTSLNATNINASGIVTATQFVTGASGSAIGISTNIISGPATIIIDPSAVGDNTGLVVIKGDLQIDGTTTTINSTTVTIDDKNIQIADGAANDAAADGAGFTIVSGDGNKTFQFQDTGDNLGSSENLNIASGKVYKVNNTSVLSATTLGSGVVNSSLTSVGTLTNLSVGNVNSSGIVTATSGFVGALTGNVTGNINSSGVSTVTSLNATNVNASGIVTATSGFVGNLTGTAGTITTFNSTNGTITNLTGTAGTITTFNSTNGTITNLTGTAGTITTFNSTNGTITNLNATNINASGIITATSGFVGNLTGTASTTTNIPNLTGDITSLNLATTLATVNSNVGSFGSQTLIPVVTVNAKGLVTAVTTAAVGTALTVSGDSGSENIDLLSETLTISGGTNLTSSAASNTLTVNLDNNISLTSVVASGIITAAGGFIGSLNVSDSLTANINSSGVSTFNSLNATNINASGIVTATSGFVGNLTGLASSATQLATGRTVAITGDLAYTSGSFNGTGNVTGTGTLATVNSNVGSFGSQTLIPVVTVNAKGLVTAVTTAAVGTALTVTGDSGSVDIDLLTETLTITGGTNLTSVGSGNTVTVNLDNNISLTSVVASGIVTATSGFVGNLTGEVNSPSFDTNASGVVITGVTTSSSGFVGALTGNVTGNLTGEVNSPSFDTNASGVVITGITTSSGGFVGALTGNVTGNLSGNINSSGVSTVTSLNATNINASGIVTATSGFVGNVTGNITGNLSGNINSSGVSTVTSLIATNINASGIVTATSGFVGNLTGEVNAAAFDTNASGVVVTGVTTSSSGFVGNLTGLASSATQLATGRTIAITGDLAYTSGSFDGTGNVTGTGTLATVNSNVGSFGSQTLIPVVTVNAKGLVTAVTTAAVGTALTVAGDSGSEDINLLSEVLTISGGTNLTSSAASNTLTINLDNNISLTSIVASGIITATSGFVGNVTGNLSGNINSSGVSTVTSLNATSINASGIVTAAQFVTGASGSAIGINTNTISGPATITIDPAGVGDNTGAVRIKGDLFVDGTQFIVNSTTIELADFVVGIASTATTDILADGAGIKIGPDNTLTYDHTNTALKSSENFNVASGKTYKINGTDVLSSTTLGSGVINSSLTSVGTLTNLSVGNVNSTGIITATTFVGALNGNVTGNINSSGVSTVASLNASNINASGIVTATSGFVGNLTGLASSATQLATGRTVAITGDLAYTSGSFDGTGNVTGTGTLATVNSNVGSFGSQTLIPVVTVNAKGLVTAVTTAAVGSGLTVSGDSGSVDIDLLTESLTISGGTNLTSVGSGSTLTINLDNNISLTSVVASGIITATSGFSGNLTGNVTGNINSSGVSTVTNLNIGGYVSIGNSTGVANQVIASTGVGVTWKTFTDLLPQTRTTQTFTATASQTLFSFVYNVNFLDVFVNGVKLSSGEFTASNGTSITLSEGAFANDTVEFVSYATLGAGTGQVSSLNDLSDVTLSGIATGNILAYNGSEFVNTSTLSNITALDATTTATIETAIAAAPNNFTSLNISGISTVTSLNATNINVSGIVTATSGFVGNLTGNVTGNLTGNVTGNINSSGVSTVTSLNATNINASGIVTATSGFSGNLTGNVTGNLTGNINSSGVSTVTSLNATNINASGISTFQGGAVVGSATTFTEDLVVQGDARVTGILTVGTASITLNGENTVINVGAATTIHTTGFAIGNSFLHSTGLSLTNLNASGIVTATTFVGALTGTATSTTNIPNLTGDITSINSVTSIAFGVIVDADINASAAIVDTKLATISTANKVSNSATTATNSNTASAIVSRDASGNFSAGTISASLTGTASSTTNIPNLTGAITSNNTTTSLGSFSSANLSAALTDETGSGSAVFATSPTLVTPVLGAATGTSLNLGNINLESNGNATILGQLELGNASDTTITRVSAGVVAIEGVNIVTVSATQTLTNKTLTSPTLTSPSLGAASASSLNVSGIVTAAQFVTGASGAAIGINTNTISGPATITIDPAAVGDNTGLVVIKGDLQIDGTTTTVNSTTMTVDDINITLASGAANSAAANGAGITIDGASATLLYASTGDKWVFNKDVEAGNFNSTSDINLKENIKQVESASELVSKLEGVHFSWKETGKETIGVIAQQIEEHLPQLVQTGDTHKTVNYNGLIGVLIEAVKEQGQMIANLQAEIEELKK